MATNGTLKPRYHILYGRIADYEEHAEVRCIPCDTMEGVVENLVTHGLHPTSTIIVLGHKVNVDEDQYRDRLTLRQEADRAACERQERAQYEYLKAKFEAKQ